MPLTLTEKILADHADKGEVHAGELVTRAAGGLMKDVAKRKAPPASAR